MKKILLIEDDILDQKAFIRFAGRVEFPYDFDIAGSVKEAKQLLESNRYDVILADYSLGDGTAFDILKVVKNIPIVIVTGTGDEEVAVKAMKLGAYDYLIKDIEGHYLKMIPVTVKNAIYRFDTEQKLQKYHENLEKLVDERTAELKKNEQFLFSILESVQDGISVLDSNLSVLHVNETMKKWYSKNAPLEGKKCYKAYHNLDKPCNPCPSLRCLESGKTEFNIVPGLPNTPIKWMELFSYPIKDPNSDKVTGVVEFVRDITERKQAVEAIERSEQKYRTLIDGTFDIVMSSELNGNIISWNRRAQEVFGYTANEIIGKNISLLVPEELFNEQKEFMTRVKNNGFVEGYESIRVAKDGTRIPVEMTVSTMKDKVGNMIGISGILRDITERKQADEELKKHREHLEELVKERTKEIEAFTYSVSHDLRAPLRAIGGFSEILWDEYNNKLDDEANRLINVIRRNTLNMNQLITDLLNFSRIGRQRVRTVEINMKNLAQEVFNELRQEYPKREIKFKLGEIPSAAGDRNLMRLVFTNLISNAIKFSEHKKIIEIEVGFIEKDKQYFYYVKDNGVGFDMKYVDKIFGVFQRLHTSAEFEGTGVGLAIVRKIIQNHGGEIRAEGEVDKGAIVYFSLKEG